VPSLFVLIVFSTLLFDTGVGTPGGGLPMIGGMSWMVVARIVRSSFLAIPKSPFI